MEFRILGPLEVLENGRSRSAARSSAPCSPPCCCTPTRSSPRPAHRRALGCLTSATAPTALQVYVSQLRKALGRDLILTQPRLPHPGQRRWPRPPSLRAAGGDGARRSPPRPLAAAGRAGPVAWSASGRAGRLLRPRRAARWKSSGWRSSSGSRPSSRWGATRSWFPARGARARAATAGTPARPADAGPLSLRPPGRRARGLPHGPAVAGRGARAQPDDELQRLERAILNHDPSLESPVVAGVETLCRTASPSVVADSERRFLPTRSL